MEWHKTLTHEPNVGATESEIKDFVSSVFAPLTDQELYELNAEHFKTVGEGYFDPPFSPSKWELPNIPLPSTYLNFLRGSNGGYFEGEHRDLDPLFTTKEIREYMLFYSIPHWMPQVCPFGFDGGGGFYLFDMREGSNHKEFPILWAHAGCLSFEDSLLLVNSFQEFIESKLGSECQ